ncbi:MAG: WD40/YVTN/BNR-like repeat-containing protein [Pyrinomonadaceae bacterium]
MKLITIVALLLIFFLPTANAQWIKQKVETTASLRGLSVVSGKVVWASGTGGTVIRTVDGGEMWKVIIVPGAEKLDFRDIEAFDADTAYILSIGGGNSSRIYKTADSGVTWKLQFQNSNDKAFFDALACWDRNNCIAMSDPVDGHYPLISTTDGGANWKPIVSNKMAAAKDGEAAFAASGTCLITLGRNSAFLVSGGNDARVFRSTDRGQTWNVADTPMIKGTAGSGVFSIAMRDAKNGIIVGGNYEKPNEAQNNVAYTTDGGKTWYPPGPRSFPNGYRSGVAYLDKTTFIAVGSSGSDISSYQGGIWKNIDKQNYNAVQVRGKAVWAVGAKGLVARWK